MKTSLVTNAALSGSLKSRQRDYASAVWIAKMHLRQMRNHAEKLRLQKKSMPNFNSLMKTWKMPNYRRNYAPLTNDYVPRIILPLKLTRYTESVITSHYYRGKLPFLVKVKFHQDKKRVIYIHRKS